MDRKITIAEITYCNSVSVAEHVVMMILALVRNYIPSYQWVVNKGWNIADCVARSYDLEGMHVGSFASGRIGLAVLRRLKAFDVKLHYTDRHRLPEAVEKELGLTFHPNVESLVKVCDVVTINSSLHPETEHLFNDAVDCEDETRRVLGEYGTGKDLRSRCRRESARKRSTGGVCRRRVVPAATAQRSSLAHHAASWHDSACFGHLIGGPSTIRRRRARDSGMLVRRPTDSQRVPDC